MKLKTKLIPLTGLAAIGATIAPIAMTSCGTSNSWVDLLQKYTSTVTPLDNVTKTVTGANTAYFGNAADGWREESDVVNLFKDDYLWYGAKSTELQSVSGSNDRYISRNVNFEYIRIGHEKYTWAGTTTEIDVPTLSYKLNYEYEYSSTTTYDTNYYTIRTESYSGTITVTNMPMQIVYLNLGNYESTYKYTWLERELWEEMPSPFWIVHPYYELMMNCELDIQYSPLVWNYTDSYNGTSTYERHYYDVVTTGANSYSGSSNVYTGIGSDNLGYQFQSGYSEFEYPIAVSHYLFSVQYGGEQ